MQIFLSYDAKSQQGFSAELTKALEGGGFTVWHDERQKRSLLRIIQSWRDPKGELGLVSWLRKGILQSDIVVGLVPYNRRPDYFPDSWNMIQVKDPEELHSIVFHESENLRLSYIGEATSKWADPSKLDQAGYYLMRPVQSLRMAWYEKHGLPPLGKDPFEHWRRWEMRVAGAAQLPVVLIVLIEPSEDAFAEALTRRMAHSPMYAILRRSFLAADFRDRLLPAIESAIPNAEEARDIDQCKRTLRRLQMRARIIILLWTCLVIGIVAFIVGVFAFFIRALFW